MSNLQRVRTGRMARCDIKFTVINHVPGDNIYILNVSGTMDYSRMGKIIIIMLDGKEIEFALDATDELISMKLKYAGIWDIEPHNHMLIDGYIILLVKPGNRIAAELVRGPDWILVYTGFEATSCFPGWSAPRIKSMPDSLPDHSCTTVVGCLQIAFFTYRGVRNHKIQATNIDPKFRILCSVTEARKFNLNYFCLLLVIMLAFVLLVLLMG